MAKRPHKAQGPDLREAVRAEVMRWATEVRARLAEIRTSVDGLRDEIEQRPDGSVAALIAAHDLRELAMHLTDSDFRAECIASAVVPVPPPTGALPDPVKVANLEVARVA